MALKRVSFVCPFCNMTIISTSIKWQERVIYSQDDERIQYAHKRCVDERNENEQTNVQNLQ